MKKPLVLLLLFPVIGFVYAGTLSCSVTTSAACTGTVVLRMSGSSNAHAELPGQANAAYDGSVVCCSGVTGLGNSCSGTTATVLKLEAVTNAHVQQNNQSGYLQNACLSVDAGGAVSVGYQSTNCTGFDTTLASIASVDNSHVGDASAYTTKVCGTASASAQPQTLSFSLSTTTVYFGPLSSVQTRYASSTSLSGSATEVEANTFSVNTNAATGYVVTVRGETLTSGSNTITALGGTNTAPSVGSSQFGLRIVASGGTGVVTSPYAASGFAYAGTSTTTSQVASASVGDSATTTYSVRYMSNISPVVPSGSYTTQLVYIATANF